MVLGFRFKNIAEKTEGGFLPKKSKGAEKKLVRF